MPQSAIQSTRKAQHWQALVYPMAKVCFQLESQQLPTVEAQGQLVARVAISWADVVSGPCVVTRTSWCRDEHDIASLIK
jgi:hypothetical protein